MRLLVALYRALSPLCGMRLTPTEPTGEATSTALTADGHGHGTERAAMVSSGRT